jgi:hypothetical protein
MTGKPASDTVSVELRDTEWIGDLYQHISTDARLGRALVQTPRFVRDFILERTLGPAIGTFGLAGVHLIDPACGTGHFLVDAFVDLFMEWRNAEPKAPARKLADRALAQVAGVDLDPICVALARVRLAGAWGDLAGDAEPRSAGRLHIDVACADSLLHGPDSDGNGPGADHRCADPDCTMAVEIMGRRYEAVVANPPYIQSKDPAKNAAYRARYRTCHGNYSLGVPFTELCWALAVRGGEPPLLVAEDGQGVFDLRPGALTEHIDSTRWKGDEP